MLLLARYARSAAIIYTEIAVPSQHSWFKWRSLQDLLQSFFSQIAFRIMIVPLPTSQTRHPASNQAPLHHPPSTRLVISRDNFFLQNPSLS